MFAALMTGHHFSISHRTWRGRLPTMRVGQIAMIQHSAPTGRLSGIPLLCRRCGRSCTVVGWVGNPNQIHRERRQRHRRRGDATHHRADDRRHGVVDIAHPHRHSIDLRRGQRRHDPVAASRAHAPADLTTGAYSQSNEPCHKAGNFCKGQFRVVSTPGMSSFELLK